MENDLINEHKEYLSNQYGIKLNRKMEILPLMYWIPKKHKNDEELLYHQNVH